MRLGWQKELLKGIYRPCDQVVRHVSNPRNCRELVRVPHHLLDESGWVVEVYVPPHFNGMGCTHPSGSHNTSMGGDLLEVYIVLTAVGGWVGKDQGKPSFFIGQADWEAGFRGPSGKDANVCPPASSWRVCTEGGEKFESIVLRGRALHYNSQGR